MRQFTILGALALTSLSGLAIAPTVSAQSAPAAAKYSTNRSTLAVLMADPEAKAILLRVVPEFAQAGESGGGNFEQAKGMTLVELKGAISAYAPTLLTDERLAQLDTEFAKLPASQPAAAHAGH